MWTNIVNEENNLQWVIEAIVNGTAVWVAGGFYHKDITPSISGVGWLIYYYTQGADFLSFTE